MIMYDWACPTAKQEPTPTRKVQITSLPDEWGQRAWAGHLCANKQKAGGRSAFGRFRHILQLANGCFVPFAFDASISSDRVFQG